MYLENIVIDAVEPQRLGRFWEAALDGDRLTDEAGTFETRLSPDGGPALDLCFQRATELPAAEPRIHFDLLGAERQMDVVERLLGLGARHLDIGQIGVPWTVLADLEGNAFCVVNDRAAYLGTGPIAALLIDSADPDRDAQFWSWLTGWPQQARAPGILRHPSRRGPLLEFCPEPAPKGATKNQLHLDIRLEAGDDPDDVAAAITERGGHELHPAWGDLPWRIYADPSGNEFCVLPIRPEDTENPAMNEMGIDVRLVPPLDPATTSPDPRVRERYTACPDGTLVSGHYIQWNGHFYGGYSIGTDLWIRHRVKGALSAEWIAIPGSYNETSGRRTFRRKVPRSEVERYVRIHASGTWRGQQIGIEQYIDNGMVAVRGGYSLEMIQLMETGAAPQLEVSEAGRAGVTGFLPWSEISNLGTAMVDLPLPEA